jgi:hypothetical protein
MGFGILLWSYPKSKKSVIPANAGISFAGSIVLHRCGLNRWFSLIPNLSCITKLIYMVILLTKTSNVRFNL